MFKASDLLTALQSTEKPYTYLFKDTSSASNLLDMLPRQNGDVNIFINFFKLVFFSLQWTNNCYHHGNANSIKILSLLY